VTVAAPPVERRPLRWLAVPIVLFALVALTVGVVAREAGPQSRTYFDLFFSDTIHMKVWLATGALACGVFQLFTASWIYGKLRWRKPPWVNQVHRWSGFLAFALILPVAYHCVFLLGFQTGTTRSYVHSLLGSALFGAYAAKVTIVELRRFPVPVLPIAGGLLFTVLLIVWWTSSLWFFRTIDTGF
jgi:Family of unknown function (DUF6529)